MTLDGGELGPLVLNRTFADLSVISIVESLKLKSSRQLRASQIDRRAAVRPRASNLPVGIGEGERCVSRQYMPAVGQCVQARRIFVRPRAVHHAGDARLPPLV